MPTFYLNVFKKQLLFFTIFSKNINYFRHALIAFRNISVEFS